MDENKYLYVIHDQPIPVFKDQNEHLGIVSRTNYGLLSLHVLTKDI